MLPIWVLILLCHYSIAFQMISKIYLNISMAQQLLHFLQFYLLKLQMYFWKYPEELKIQKNIYKHSWNIQKVSTRNEKRKYQQRYEISNRQYEKRHFTLKRTNIKPTTVKTLNREWSISRNIAARYTRNNPSNLINSKFLT